MVEIIPYYDARHAPLTGIFPRLSSLIGLHHFSYQIEDQRNIENRELSPESLASDVSIFVNTIFDPITGETVGGTGKLSEKMLPSSSSSLSSVDATASSVLFAEHKDKEEIMKSYKADGLGIDYGG